MARSEYYYYLCSVAAGRQHASIHLIPRVVRFSLSSSYITMFPHLTPPFPVIVHCTEMVYNL